MGTGVDLLRLLEPTVRPAGLPGPTPKASTPIESRSFDSVLEEAQGKGGQESTGDEVEAVAGASQTKTVSALAPLTQLDRIENPAMRLLLGGGSAAGAGTSAVGGGAR